MASSRRTSTSGRRPRPVSLRAASRSPFSADDVRLGTTTSGSSGSWGGDGVGSRGTGKTPARREPMAAVAHEPLRELTEAEREHLAALVRARSERVDVRQRAVALLAVAQGQSREAAARQAGYAHGYTVSRLIQRFNAHGLAALAIASGRGRPRTYTAAERQQILEVLQHAPEREAGQSATSSLTLPH